MVSDLLVSGTGVAALISKRIFFKTFEVTDRKSTIVKILAPIEPRVILCVGLNYRKLAEATGSKFPELQNPGDPIVLPTHLRSDAVDDECELAVIIGRECKNAAKDRALDSVFGYTAANDVTARDWQTRWGGGQFCRGKSFDYFRASRPSDHNQRRNTGSERPAYRDAGEWRFTAETPSPLT